MQVAVIMSVRNCERFVSKSIESILNQTCNDLILYILDDGSTDSTYSIVKNHECKRVKIHQSPESVGLAPRLNQLIDIVFEEQPDVKYIARQDGDDWSAPSRIAEEIDFLERNKDYGMVGTWYYIIDVLGNILSTTETKTGYINIKSDFYFQNWFGHGTILFRSDALRTLRYDERFTLCQDYELYSRIMEDWKIDNIPKPLFYWRSYHANMNPEKVMDQKYYINLARYKMYCRQMGIPFIESNYRETFWK